MCFAQTIRYFGTWPFSLGTLARRAAGAPWPWRKPPGLPAYTLWHFGPTGRPSLLYSFASQRMYDLRFMSFEVGFLRAKLRQLRLFSLCRKEVESGKAENRGWGVLRNVSSAVLELGPSARRRCRAESRRSEGRGKAVLRELTRRAPMMRCGAVQEPFFFSKIRGHSLRFAKICLVLIRLQFARLSSASPSVALKSKSTLFLCVFLRIFAAIHFRAIATKKP